MATQIKLLVAASVSASLATAACTNFNVVNQVFEERNEREEVPYLIRASYPVWRISPGVVCNSQNADSSCIGSACLPEAVNGTFLATAATTNITMTSSVDAEQIFGLAQSALQIPFPVSANTTLGAPNANTYRICIPATEAGYLTFTTDYYCAQGILTCDDSRDGSAVMLCAPMISGSNMQMQGAINFVTADASLVSTLTDVAKTPGAISTAAATGASGAQILVPTSSYQSGSSTRNIAPSPVGPTTTTLSSVVETASSITVTSFSSIIFDSTDPATSTVPASSTSTNLETSGVFSATTAAMGPTAPGAVTSSTTATSSSPTPTVNGNTPFAGLLEASKWTFVLAIVADIPALMFAWL